MSNGSLDSWSHLPHWIKNNRFFKKDLENGGEMKEVSPEHANLVSSHFYTTPGGKEAHFPILDLDMEAKLLPSSTPGHYHLFINKVMSKDQYDKLLRVLNEVGIIQDGIIKYQWEQEGVTCARMPGIKKTNKSMSSGGVIKGSAPKFSDPVTNKINANAINPGIIDNIPDDLLASEISVAAQPDDITTTNKWKLVSDDENKNLLPGTQDAILIFRHLAEVAKHLNITLYEVVGAWKEFCKGVETKDDNPF